MRARRGRLPLLIIWRCAALPVFLGAALAAQARDEMPCRRGMSDGVYPCRNVNLQARLALNDFPGRPERAGNLWGFADPKDGREYALVGLSNGTAVVEVSEPTAPRIVGLVAALSSSFREPRVYAYINKRGQRGAVAYVATEASGSGLQVIDLSQLPDSVRLARVDRDIDTAHTLHVSNVDPATGLAVDGLAPALYAQGIRPGIGLAAFSLRRPKNPRRLGTFRPVYHCLNRLDAAKHLVAMDQCAVGVTAGRLRIAQAIVGTE